MLSLFGFGKRRRKVKKGGKKPSKKLLSICKRYGVKAMSKGKYRSTKTLKKMCLKKVMVIYKKMVKNVRKTHFGAKGGKNGRKSGSRMSKCGSAFGAKRKSSCKSCPLTFEQAKKKVAALAKKKDLDVKYCKDLKLIREEYGGTLGKRCTKLINGCTSAFGKRRRAKKASSRKVSKKHAMKAFNKFYKTHCRSRSRFGGNPPLAMSMGNEFCSNGSGVLGYNSTGLFPSPCSATVATPMAAFGRRRCRTGYRRAKTDKRKCVRGKGRKAPCKRRRRKTCKPRKSSCSTGACPTAFGAKRRSYKRRKTPCKRRKTYRRRAACPSRAYVPGSPCNYSTKEGCVQNPNCLFNERIGCVRRKGVKCNPVAYGSEGFKSVDEWEAGLSSAAVPAAGPDAVPAPKGVTDDLTRAVLNVKFGRRRLGFGGRRSLFGYTRR